MDHVVYVDSKAKELKKILEDQKTMIIRGATGKKLPYGRVFEGDILYFIENNGDGMIKAKAIVKSVFNSEKMTIEESKKLIINNQSKLNLTDIQFKKWSEKKYLVLIEIKNIEKIDHFFIDKSNYGNMDDWLPVENINSIPHHSKYSCN
jgi:hypothetical protein